MKFLACSYDVTVLLSRGHLGNVHEDELMVSGKNRSVVVSTVSQTNKVFNPTSLLMIKAMSPQLDELGLQRLFNVLPPAPPGLYIRGQVSESCSG
jgi:hypothetical protein